MLEQFLFLYCTKQHIKSNAEFYKFMRKIIIQVFLFSDGIATEYPVIKLSPMSIVDTTGAGDAFVGGNNLFFSSL